MVTLKFVLLFTAFISFLLAALGVSSPRVNLVALGLMLWILAVIVT